MARRWPPLVLALDVRLARPPVCDRNAALAVSFVPHPAVKQAPMPAAAHVFRKSPSPAPPTRRPSLLLESLAESDFACLPYRPKEAEQANSVNSPEPGPPSKDQRAHPSCAR